MAQTAAGIDGVRASAGCGGDRPLRRAGRAPRVAVPSRRTARRTARQHSISAHSGGVVLGLDELFGLRAPRRRRTGVRSELRDQRLARDLAARIPACLLYTSDAADE